ncbi:MAG TPA: ABC transporter substrate-binding protein [Ilumatobacter sp.]|nr:ABC transporter substrate-binding protein [Ilumatobacter sp.]
MQKTRVRRAGALLVGLSLVAVACGGDDDDTTATQPPVATDAPGTDAPSTDAPTTDAPSTDAPSTDAPSTDAPSTDAPTTDPPTSSGGELAGMRGTTPKGADVAAWIPAVNDFWVAKGNDPLSDFNYAAESYDAAIVIALAVHAANDDGSEHANHIVDVTREGTKCTSFAECRDLLDAGEDIDYDGVSGPLDFNGNGEPLMGSYAVLQFGDNNRIIEGDEDLRVAQLPDSAVVDLVEVGVERAGDGVLKIGTLLPETGNLAFLGPPEFAGVEFAIEEINAAGGVLGNPVEYTQGDSGDTTTDTATVTATRLLGEGVDAIIGAASSGVTFTVIDQITSAGVTMFSPANTAAALSDYDDNGLFFRDAPSDAMQGAIVADLVAEDGNASVYVLNLDDAYGNGIAAIAAELLAASGIEVLGVKAYDPAAPSFDAEVSDIVATDPDAVVLISFDEGSKILRTAVEQGVGPSVKNYYGTDGNMGNALGENFDAGS